MKKRILMLLISFILVVGLMPMVSFASTSEVRVSGTVLVEDVYYLVVGEGADATLTTEGASATKYNVWLSGTLLTLYEYDGGPISTNFTVLGINAWLEESTVTAKDSKSAAIHSEGSITFSAYNLTVNAYDASEETEAVDGGDGIYAKNGIIFESGEVEVFTGKASETGAAHGTAIKSNADVTVKKSATVNATAQAHDVDKASYGIECDNFTMESEDTIVDETDYSKLNLTGGTAALKASGDVTINGYFSNLSSYHGIICDSMTVTGGMVDVKADGENALAIDSESAIAISGGDFQAQILNGDEDDYALNPSAESSLTDKILVGVNDTGTQAYTSANNQNYKTVKLETLSVTQDDVVYNGSTSTVEPQTIDGVDIKYSGTLSDESDTNYAETANKPTEVGSYTVTVSHGGVSENDTFAITPKEIEVTSGTLVYSKKYDGNTDINASSSITGEIAKTGIIDGDACDVTFTHTAYTDKNVATTNNTVYGNLALSGDDSFNYKLKSSTLNVPAQINPIQLSWNEAGTVNDKVYDENTSATQDKAPTFSGVLSGETVGVKVGTLNFSDSNVGKDLTVSVAGYSIVDSATNYLAPINQPTFGVADITKANYPTNQIAISSNGKYGTSGIVPLQAWGGILEADFTTFNTSSHVSDPDSILDSVSLTGTGLDAVINYELEDDPETAEKTAYVTVPVKTRNYNDFSVTITITVDKLEAPSITLNPNAKVEEGKAFTVGSDAEFIEYIRTDIIVNGVTTTIHTSGNDNDKAKAEEGSIIVTLSAEYLSTLPAGTHTVAIVSDGGVASTSFTVAATATPTPAPTTTPTATTTPTSTTTPDGGTPQTGENFDIIVIPLVLLVLSAMSVLAWYMAKLAFGSNKK